MKKIIIWVIVVIAVVVLFFVFLYKPDLVIQNVEAVKLESGCAYEIEIANKGLRSVQGEILPYCFWPEGKSICEDAWDVVNRNPVTGEVKPLNLGLWKKHKFQSAPTACNSKFYRPLTFCIDCGFLQTDSGKVLKNKVKEIREGNNEFFLKGR